MCHINRTFHKDHSSKNCKVKEFMEEIGYFQEIETTHDYKCSCGHEFQINHTYNICPKCETKYIIHPSNSHRKEYILKVGVQ